MASILIIDDDEQVLAMLGQTLEREGYDVVKAFEGEAAVMQYREQPTDLIITDLLMPGQEGLETIIELRREFPDVKIIAMSGGGRINPGHILNLAKGLGAQYTFMKPVDRKELLDAIQEMIG
jgi:CheY-like chemotaxis protein